MYKQTQSYHTKTRSSRILQMLHYYKVHERTQIHTKINRHILYMNHPKPAEC